MTIISKLVPGGQGITTLENGKKAFLWNALPGEEILEFKITKNKASYLEGIATKINRSSSSRITPKDSHFLSTSPWQILDYQSELSFKHELLVETFHQFKLPTHNIQPVVTDYRDFFYRNKMEYSLYWNHDTNKIHLAFHQRGSHTKIPIINSSLERPEILQAAQNIIADLNLRQEPARKYQSLLLRSDQLGNISGGLLEKHQPHPKFTPLSDQILNTTYHYSPNGFFQINLPLYNLVLIEIIQQLQKFNSSKILDLYSGVGTIGLSVARDRELTLVESNPSAFSELGENSQNFPKAKPILAKSEDALEYISSDQIVILDPPRAGCEPKLIEKLIYEKPEAIFYLSCNPATQARDLALLTQSYRIEKIIPYNFFPRTPHLENLTILKLNQP